MHMKDNTESSLHIMKQALFWPPYWGFIADAYGKVGFGQNS